MTRVFAKIYLIVNFLGPPRFCLSLQQSAAAEEAAMLLCGAQARRVFELCMHVSVVLGKKGEEGRDAPGDVGEEWLKIKCEEGESLST